MVGRYAVAELNQKTMETQNKNPNNVRKGLPTKRARDDRSDSSDDLSDSPPPPPPAAAAATTTNWPRFLLVKSADTTRPVAKLSPFAIAKAIQGLAGEPKQVRKLRSGDLLVEVCKKAHSDNLLKSSTFAGVPVKVEAHTSLNTSKGIIRSRDLLDVSETELLEELSDQGVEGVKRFTYRKDGSVRPSLSVLLTFSSPTLPDHIKAGYLRIPVEPFIPSPLRCFKCQEFGHHRDRCPRSARCGRCGAEHEEDSCKSAPRCVNCAGSHPSFSRDCPQWQLEREIQRVRVTQRVSFPEARRLVTAGAGAKSGGSYASVVRARRTVSVEVQTELSCLQGSFPLDGPSAVSAAVQTASEKESATPSTSSKESAPTPKAPAAPRPVTPRDPPPIPKLSKKQRQQANRFSLLQQEEPMEGAPPPRPNVKHKK